MFRGVVFDLDGTLVDTLDEITGCLNRALASLELETHCRETVRAWVGDGADRLVERAVADARAGLRAEALARVRAEYEASAGGASRPYPGIPEALEQLAAAGVELAVLTNKSDDAARTMIDRFFPSRFAHVAGLGEGEPRKPDPRTILGLLAHLRLAPEEAVMVGDSEVDVATGRAAGVAVIAATWGFRSRRRLQRESPRWLIDTPAEIAAIVGVGE